MGDRPQVNPELEALTGFLVGRDAACPVCTYNLRGLKTGACPECGAPLQLQVGSENLRLGPWFLGVVSFALALGFDAVVSLMICVGVTIATIRNGVPPIGQAWPIIRVAFIFSILVSASGLGLSLMFRRRVAWRRMPVRRQWRMAVAIFILTFLVHAAAGGLIFYLNQ